MAVVAKGPSEVRSSQQEVTLVPQASHRIVSSFDGDATVGVERRGCGDAKEGHVICNLCCACALHEVETSERRLHYADRRALVFGGEHSERGAEILHQSVGD